MSYVIIRLLVEKLSLSTVSTILSLSLSHIMTWLCNLKITRPIHADSQPVWDKANARQAGIVTAAAVKCQPKVWWHCIVVPLLAPFVFESGPADVFKGADNIVGGEMPGFMILSLGELWVIVDATGMKGFFQAVLKLLL